MGWAGGGQAVRILVASIALLLGAGGIAAAVVDSPAPTPTAAGGREAVTSTVAGETSSTTAAVGPTTTFPSPAIVSTTTTRRPPAATTATTAKRVTTSAVPATRPPIQTIPTTPRVPPATSWTAAKNGVSVRVHIEPTTPIAGQPVRFVIDVVSVDPCCLIAVSFGEGSASAANVTEVCTAQEPLVPGSGTFEATYSYGAPGAYAALVSVDADSSCLQPLPPGGRVGIPDVLISACVAVGPGTAGQAGCTRSLGAG